MGCVDAETAESLQRLLAHKRAQVRPEDVDLPPKREGGRGRSAPGLRQEDMDLLLGRSEGTFARLERGQLKRVPEKLCRQVAEVLRFTEKEWQALWVFLHGQQPPHPLDPVAASRVPPHWGQGVRGISWPAYVTDQAWQLEAWNDAFAQIFPHGIPPRNTMRWMALEADARRRLVNWEREWAPLVLPQLRAALAEYPDNEVLRELEGDVRRDPVAGPMYDRGREAYLQPDGDVRELLHDGLGFRRRVQLFSATPTGSPGARFMMLMWVDGR